MANKIPTPRLYALDGLRGLCAISVMCYHFCSWNGIEYFQVGLFGVYLFYVLSGFSMWYVYARQPITPEMLEGFFIARFARIFPLYMLAGILVIIAKYVFMDESSVFTLAFLNRILLNATFLFGLAAPGQTSDIPGGWSIGIEWVFYLVFPLFLFFMRRLSVMLVLLVGAFIINQVIAVSLLADSTLGDAWISYTHFPTFLVYFIAGITGAELYARLQAKGWRCHPALCRLVPLALLALILFYPSRSAEAYLMGPHVAFLIGAAMLALLVGAFMQPTSAAERGLYAFLGNVSYSTYLMHFFVYNTVQRVLAHIAPESGLVPLFVLSGAGTLILAALLYRYFEAPARGYINRIGTRR